jgi:hypothetical protein
MTLIKSISGIRGTIGGRVGDGLKPFRYCEICIGLCHFHSEKVRIMIQQNSCWT